jgi:hypothetical protein
MVPEVNEQQAAMVADAVHPPGQAHGCADGGCPELAAGMGSVAMHAGRKSWN